MNGGQGQQQEQQNAQKMQFMQLLRQGGLPTTEAEVRAQFEQAVDAEEVAFSNDTKVSPWWKMLTLLVTRAVMWLIEALATTVLPEMYVKTASRAGLILLADGVNLTPKAPTKARGQVQFVRADSVGVLTVAADTPVQSPPINGRIYTVMTTAAVDFAEGQTTVLAPVEAEAVGSAYNLGAGYYRLLPKAVPGVTGVQNLEDWLQQPGTDEEGTEDLRERIRTQFLALNQWHTDAVYRAIIASFDGVSTDNVFFDSDAPRGPGTADAYVMFELGSPSEEFLQTIQRKIMDQGNHGHGDDLRVRAMPETEHDVTLTLYPQPNLTPAETETLAAEVEHFIRAAFRENQDYQPTLPRPWSRFSFSKLSQELHREFADIDSLAFANADILSEMALARLKTLKVTTA